MMSVSICDSGSGAAMPVILVKASMFSELP
jgi:hypothetical protein